MSVCLDRVRGRLEPAVVQALLKASSNPNVGISGKRKYFLVHDFCDGRPIEKVVNNPISPIIFCTHHKVTKSNGEQRRCIQIYLQSLDEDLKQELVTSKTAIIILTSASILRPRARSSSACADLLRIGPVDHLIQLPDPCVKSHIIMIINILNCAVAGSEIDTDAGTGPGVIGK